MIYFTVISSLPLVVIILCEIKENSPLSKSPSEIDHVLYDFKLASTTLSLLLKSDEQSCHHINLLKCVVDIVVDTFARPCRP